MRRRGALVAATLAAAGVLFTACSSSSGDAQAAQACVHVNRSIVLYDRSLHERDTTVASNEQQHAQHELLVAEPLAAAATSADGSWNGLQTTLIESERVSEGNLLVALQSECADVVVSGTASDTVPSGATGGTTATTGNPKQHSGPVLPPGA